MSQDVNRDYFWRTRGSTLEVLKLKRSGSAVKNDGSLSPNRDELIYPDESVDDGVRVEYTAFVNPFVSADPNVLATGDTNETTWTNPDLTPVTSPTETTHVNLNRLLSMAVVSYIKAMVSELKGDLKAKEYYLREFWKRVSDAESNKRMVSMSFPTSPFAVR